MKWVCQLGDGNMLAMDGGSLWVVSTGYPYPDTLLPQQDMLRLLFEGEGYPMDLSYQDVVDRLRGIFIGNPSGKLDVKYVLSMLVPGEASPAWESRCFYHDDNVGVYVFEGEFPGDGIRRLDFKVEGFVGSDGWVLILPVSCESEYAGRLDIPGKPVGSVLFPYVLQGFRFPILMRKFTFSVLISKKGDAPFFRACVPRMLCGVVPCLDLPDWAVSELWDGYASLDSHAVSNEWMTLFYRASMDEVLHRMDDLRGYVLHLAVRLKMREYYEMPLEAVKRDEWQGGRVVFESPGLGEAWQLNKSDGYTPAMNVIFDSGIEVLSEDKLGLSLMKLLGKTVSPFFIGNGCLFGSDTINRVDCMQCLEEVFGCSRADLAKKMLLGGKAGAANDVDLSRVESVYKPVAGYSQVLIPMLSTAEVSASGWDNTCMYIRAFDWIPSSLLSDVSGKQFGKKYRKELLVVLTQRVLKGYLFQNSFSSNTVIGLFDALHKGGIRFYCAVGTTVIKVTGVGYWNGYVS